MDYQVILRDEAGRELTWADLKGVSGKVNYEIVGGAPIPPEANRLHQQGRRFGQEGKYDEALKLFEQAHRLAPDWPYPLYDAAFTYLNQGDYARAMEYYARVNEMAPRGFFTAKTALDTLQREQAGIAREGTYRILLQLEWMQDPAAKREILEQILEHTPQLPMAWQKLASLLDDDEASLQAISKGLSYQPDADTRGLLLINKALILYRQGKESEAIEMLGQLALDPDSTLHTEQAAKFALANLLGHD